MKLCEYFDYQKGLSFKVLWSNGKCKYRYIEKRTCRGKRHKLKLVNLKMWEE